MSIYLFLLPYFNNKLVELILSRAICILSGDGLVLEYEEIQDFSRFDEVVYTHTHKKKVL